MPVSPENEGSPTAKGASGTAAAAASYLAYPVKYAMTSAWKKLPREIYGARGRSSQGEGMLRPKASTSDIPVESVPQSRAGSVSSTAASSSRFSSFTLQTPPLTPLILVGSGPRDNHAGLILNSLVAEEIRLLIPPRLQLCEHWNLVFSLERHGASLNTLYHNCDAMLGKRAGCVLVVRDASGSMFGAYLTDAPRPSNGHYYGNGECFLWQSSVMPAMLTLDSLPPPPSADTTHATRATTIGGPSLAVRGSGSRQPDPALISRSNSPSERMRFKAFPYSGENDYFIFCEPGFLSVGGGNGHYGLWLGDDLEYGISEACPTFGNEPLSAAGAKFQILGIELWSIGAS